MNENRNLAEILKDYFLSSNERFAVEFRKTFAVSTVASIIDAPLEETDLEDWIDSQDVLLLLHISPRTLQTLRSNSILPFSRIANKIYYRKRDILKLLADNYIMSKVKEYGHGK